MSTLNPIQLPKIINRRFKQDDAAACAHLFHDSIHQGAVGFYDSKQRQAWPPAVPNALVWSERLSSQITYIAEDNSTLVGFMALNETGYIDLAFVAPDRIGKGVGKLLYDRIENHAVSIGIDRLYTHASHQARRHFERQGWKMTENQSFEKKGVSIENFLMDKTL